MTKEEQISRVAEILKAECGECAEESGWCIQVIAKKLVLHPDTPVRTAEGFAIVEWGKNVDGGKLFKSIKPIQYGGKTIQDVTMDDVIIACSEPNHTNKQEGGRNEQSL